MNSDNIQDWIDLFLSDQLEGSELRKFEDKMASDSSFKAEVDFQRELQEALSDKEVLDLSQKIRSVQEKKTTKKKEPKLFPMRNVLRIAAGFALLVSVYFVISQFESNQSPQELAGQYFERETEIVSNRSTRSRSEIDTINANINLRSSTLDQVWIESNTFYKLGEFEKALSSLNRIEQIDSTFQFQSASEFHYYKGLLLMCLKEYRKAIASFDQVKIFQEKALMNKALSYLQLNEVEKAKIILLHLSTTSSQGDQERVKKILQQLK